MRTDDIDDFQRLMTDALAFYGKDVSEFAMSVWWAACKDFDLEQVRKALTAHAMDPDSGQFAPKPADLVRVLQGTKTDRSLLAWSRVYRAMSDVGAYASPDFGDSAIHAAITDMGGWPNLCHTSINELPFTQRRFCDLYRAHANRGAEDVPLLGMHAQAAIGVSNAEYLIRIGQHMPNPMKRLS